MGSDKTTGKTVKGKPRGRPFPPHNNANPKGRPPAGESIAEKLRALKSSDEIAKAIVDGSKNGDPRMITIYLERTEGRVKQGVELSGEVGGIDAIETRRFRELLYAIKLEAPDHLNAIVSRWGVDLSEGDE